MKKTNLAKWLQKVILQCKQDVTQGERQFVHLSVDEDVKQWKSYVCHVDEDRMAQVFTNLILNAVKYTTIERGKIEVAVQIADDEVMIVIKDNGYGIEQEELPYLFERFYRVESEPSASGAMVSGTGLGLAIVKEIVHQRKVWVESKVNEGSAFHVVLPLVTDV